MNNIIRQYERRLRGICDWMMDCVDNPWFPLCWFSDDLKELINWTGDSPKAFFIITIIGAVLLWL